MILKAHASLATIATGLASDARFLASNSTPAWRDCGLFGVCRTLIATDRELSETVFCRRMGHWVEDVHGAFFGETLDELRTRDLK